MREALRQAQRRPPSETMPIGCVIVRGDKIIARDITGVMRIKVCCPTPKLFPLKRHAKNRRLAFGGLHHVCNAGAMPHVPVGIVQARIPWIAWAA